MSGKEYVDGLREAAKQSSNPEVAQKAVELCDKLYDLLEGSDLNAAFFASPLLALAIYNVIETYSEYVPSPVEQEEARFFRAMQLTLESASHQIDHILEDQNVGRMTVEEVNRLFEEYEQGKKPDA